MANGASGCISAAAVATDGDVTIIPFVTDAGVVFVFGPPLSLICIFSFLIVAILRRVYSRVNQIATSTPFEVFLSLSELSGGSFVT